ncbi:hypothetical protein HYQ44_005232 [Verticillium longisporum]|nr:hypothetical protein HYQ44_005232 [Verticillium longisporum]
MFKVLLSQASLIATQQTDTKKTTRLTEETEHIVESHITWVAGIFSTFIAALLLLGAIVALRLIKQQDVQLGVIAIFTILFSASVKVMTNARRAEIFGSTAAYAAVLVVFVSSSPSSPDSTCCTSAP